MAISDVWGNSWGSSWAAHWRQATVAPVQEVSGGDDAWHVTRVDSKPRKHDESPLAEELRQLYEGLPEPLQVEVKSDVVRFAEKLPARRRPVPVSYINFELLAENVAAVQALLDAYQQSLVERALEEEREVELLLMAA